MSIMTLSAGLETRMLHLPMAPPQEESSVVGVVEAAAEAGFNAVALTAYESGRICWPGPARGRRPKPWPDSAAGLRELLPAVCAAASQAGLLTYAVLPLLSLNMPVAALSRPLSRWVAELDEAPGAHAGDIPYLCYSRAEVCRYLGDMACELVIGYPVHGIILGAYARPGQFHAPERALCRCTACREAVDKALLFDLRKLTADPADDRYQRWAQWQVTQIGEFLEGLICRMRAVRCGLRVLLDVPPEAESQAVVRVWLEQGLAHGAVHHGESPGPASRGGLLQLACREAKGGDDLRPPAGGALATQSDGFVARVLSWPDAETVTRFGSVFAGAAVAVERDPVASAMALLDRAGLEDRRGLEAQTLRHVREVLDASDEPVQPEILADLALDCWYASARAADDLAKVAGAVARLLQLAALL